MAVANQVQEDRAPHDELAMSSREKAELCFRDDFEECDVS